MGIKHLCDYVNYVNINAVMSICKQWRFCRGPEGARGGQRGPGPSFGEENSQAKKQETFGKNSCMGCLDS